MYKENLNICICILFFEKVQQTIECVQSFLPSKVPIYILNNNSSEESTKILKEFCKKHSQVKIFDSPQNLGVSGGRNFLINNTTEDWMFFVDNDIIINTSNWLEIIADLIEKNPQIEAFIPRLYNLHEKKYANRYPFIIRNKTLIRDENSKSEIINRFSGGASIISRELFDRLGFYCEEMFVGFEDYEMALRAIMNSKQIKAKLVNSIELIHDHRIAINVGDKKSVQARYDLKKHKISSGYIKKKYGIRTSPGWQYWLNNQKKLMMHGKTIRPVGYFKRARLKINDILWKLSKF